MDKHQHFDPESINFQVLRQGSTISYNQQVFTIETAFSINLKRFSVFNDVFNCRLLLRIVCSHFDPRISSGQPLDIKKLKSLLVHSKK